MLCRNGVTLNHSLLQRNSVRQSVSQSTIDCIYCVLVRTLPSRTDGTTKSRVTLRLNVRKRACHNGLSTFPIVENSWPLSAMRRQLLSEKSRFARKTRYAVFHFWARQNFLPSQNAVAEKLTPINTKATLQPYRTTATLTDTELQPDGQNEELQRRHDKDGALDRRVSRGRFRRRRSNRVQTGTRILLRVTTQPACPWFFRSSSIIAMALSWCLPFWLVCAGSFRRSWTLACLRL